MNNPVYRRWIHLIVRFLLLCAAMLMSLVPNARAQTDASAWSRVPEILSRIVPPTFPANDFNIVDYGAVGDGVTDCTLAFSNAIAACNAAGGGRVVVPSGVFFSSAIHLLSDVNLQIFKNATIKFSADPNAYLPVVYTRYESTEVMNYSPFIYAFEQTNIAITGEGTIDGQGPLGPWYFWKTSGLADAEGALLVSMADTNLPVEQRIFGAGHYLRPNFVQPFRCRNVLIEGIHIVNSPMWVLNPEYCTNVTIRNVTVNSTGPNSDGCDPDSCTDVLIRGCSFTEGDDCVAVKSGRDVDGRRVNIPSRNIIVQNCKFQDGHGGITAGSETAAGITNVFLENCAFDSPNLQKAIRLKTCAERGGGITDFYVRNCVIKTTQVGIHIDMLYCSGGTNYPVVKNVDIRDCAFVSLSSRPIYMRGINSSFPVTDVNIVNCRFPDSTAGNFFQYTNRINRINNRGGGG